MPFDLSDILTSGPKLLDRRRQIKTAKKELTNEYTIGEVTATGYEFMFGSGIVQALALDDADRALEELVETVDGPWRLSRRFGQEFSRPEDDRDDAASRPLTELFLDDPKQFSMSWTNHRNVFQDALPLLDQWASSLTDVDAANAQFWPTIARYGMPYNLLILKKVSAALREEFNAIFPEGWPDDLEQAFAAGNLYLIDMRIFSHLKPHWIDGSDRFTPSTVTWLVQDPQTKALTPAAIHVSGFNNSDAALYRPDDPAWLYALQAAKTSITLYGIWLGHVYHWHIVTAAMQMTMFNTLPTDHAIYQLLAPQSNYVIAFDNILLLLWRQIGPPTSISTPVEFLRLMDRFATGRDFFDDDPKTAMQQFGIREEDFSVEQPWDQYPIVGQFFELWDATQRYVTTFVDQTYADDRAVSSDPRLQKWIRDSGKPAKGNVRGLPEMDSRSALKDVLTSLLYRIVAHGIARLNPALNPAETFVANFPPCLQKRAIPSPQTSLSTDELLRYMPKTDTLGKMVNFYYIFVFSLPYEPLLPSDGMDSRLFFPGGPSSPRNQALIEFRNEIDRFLRRFDPASPQPEQWPMNVET